MSKLIEVLRKSLQKENPTRGEMELEREIMKAIIDELPTGRSLTEEAVACGLREAGRQHGS